MHRVLRLALGLCLASNLHAAETAPVDPDLPQPFSFDSQTLTGFRTHSPFNRVVSLENTYQLTGVAYIDGKPMATLMNRETKQRFVVSEETNALGMTLTEAKLGDEPDKAEVHVMIGPEEVVMHYAEMEVAPEGSKGSKNDSSSSAKKLFGSAHSHSGRQTEIDTASLLGNQGKEMLNALSPEGREKFAAIMAASAEKHPERSKEEFSAAAQKIYAKMKSSEEKAQVRGQSGGTPKPAKPEKPRKR